MKITRSQLRSIIKEAAALNERRSPRSALALAKQVDAVLSSAGQRTMLDKTPDYPGLRHLDGQFMSKSTHMPDGSSIDLPIYDLGGLVRVPAAMEVLAAEFGQVQKMKMGFESVDAIPVGKFAIVFGGTRNGTVGIAKKV